jgi:hypothetical protein
MNFKKCVSAAAVCIPLWAVANDVAQPPELWSAFKDLNKSAAACQLQSKFVLEQMGVERLVDNDNGLYGVLKGNRVVVKCTGSGAKSVLWVAVAGADRDSVALIRNKIHADIQ